MTPLDRIDPQETFGKFDISFYIQGENERVANLFVGMFGKAF